MNTRVERPVTTSSTSWPPTAKRATPGEGISEVSQGRTEPTVTSAGCGTKVPVSTASGSWSKVGTPSKAVRRGADGSSRRSPIRSPRRITSICTSSPKRARRTSAAAPTVTRVCSPWCSTSASGASASSSSASPSHSASSTSPSRRQVPGTPSISRAPSAGSIQCSPTWERIPCGSARPRSRRSRKARKSSGADAVMGASCRSRTGRSQSAPSCPARRGLASCAVIRRRRRPPRTPRSRPAPRAEPVLSPPRSMCADQEHPAGSRR